MWPSVFYNGGSSKVGTEEFRQIFLDLYPELCYYASTFVVDIETSKDIAQEVLARFWMESDKLVNKNLIKPYLFKAIKNRALNHNKREKRKTGLDALLGEIDTEIRISDSSDAVSVISYKNLQADLESAIKQMPDQRRRIFEMSRYEQMKHKEIATELQISPKTVETQIYRSLTFLREKLKHHLLN